MTLNGIRETIDSERTLLLALKEKVTSPYLKQQCQRALNDLDVWEYLCFGGGLENPTAYLGQATVFVQIAVSQRKAVEEAVSKWGDNAIAVPDDLKRR